MRIVGIGVLSRLGRSAWTRAGAPILASTPPSLFQSSSLMLTLLFFNFCPVPPRARDRPTAGLAVPLNVRAPRVRALAPGAPSASGQTRYVDLQARVAAQMWPEQQVFWRFPPWRAGPPRPLADHAPPPHAGGRSCSIPAGPALFISSQAAMINEALNTSSPSPGPAEPHS